MESPRCRRQSFSTSANIFVRFLFRPLLLLFPLFNSFRASSHWDKPKALFYVPTLSYSHLAFNFRLAELLQRNGHNVTLLVVVVDSTVRIPTFEGVDTPNIRRVNVGLRGGVLPRTLWTNPGPYEDASPLNPRISLKLIRVAGLFTKACKELLSNRELLEQLHSEHFQLGFAEQYDPCGFGLFKQIGITKMLWLSATATFRLQMETMGLPQPLSYVPELFSPLSDRMLFDQRVLNWLIAKLTEHVHNMLSVFQVEQLLISQPSFSRSRNNVLRSQGRSIVSNNATKCCLKATPQRSNADHAASSPVKLMQFVAHSTTAVLTNTATLLDFPAPSTNFIRPIAGITIRRDFPRGTLDENWSELVEGNAFNRFWVVTFGSIARTADMPSAMLRSLRNAFEHFPNILFIVKFERIPREVKMKPFLPAGNVVYARWIPQLELISHPKCDGILTHGGWSGVLEAVWFGRPMLLMPLFADHFKNARAIEAKGLAVIVDKLAVDELTFVNAFGRIIGNEQAKLVSDKFARMLRDAATLISPEGIVLYQTRNAMKRGPRGNKKRRRLTTMMESEDGGHFSHILALFALICLISW